jgi:hypothetical protein
MARIRIVGRAARDGAVELALGGFAVEIEGKVSQLEPVPVP